jgi:hypothetical protein
MTTRDEIDRELDDLLKQQSTLIGLARGGKVLEFGAPYQNWFTRATRIVEALAPDRYEEFVGYYRIDPKRKNFDASTYVIQDYVMGIGPGEDYSGKTEFDDSSVVSLRLLNQFQILAALRGRIDTVVSNVTGHLLAELQDKELDAAARLVKVNLRAAGALAGVVLERHLQRVAENRGVVIRKKQPSISDLNDALKDKGVYDLPTWRKIQLLGDIRNVCAHKKSRDPTELQVEELIAGVNSIIKSVF